MYLGLSYYEVNKNNKINLDKAIYYLAKFLNNNNNNMNISGNYVSLQQEVYSSLTTAYEQTHNYICAINTVSYL